MGFDVSASDAHEVRRRSIALRQVVGASLGLVVPLLILRQYGWQPALVFSAITVAFVSGLVEVRSN